MRISGGEAKGTPLRVPKGARPASERVRLAIFTSIADRVPGARVLDLYCGSGAYGLEALSRGASGAVLVDRDPRAIVSVKHNAAAAGLDARATARRRDVARYDPVPDGPFDLVFVDPPYGTDPPLTVLEPALRDGATVVVEARKATNHPETPAGWVLEDDRRYGDTRVLRYRPRGTEPR